MSTTFIWREPAFLFNSKAYIPLQRKTNRVGSWRWLGPPTPQFYPLTPLPPTPNLKFALPPTRKPNASQWNIGCVGSQTQISRVGHVHFIFFGVDFICIGYPTQTRFQWNTTCLIYKCLVSRSLLIRFGNVFHC